MSARAQLAGSFYLAGDRVRSHAFDQHQHRTIVDDESIALTDIIHQAAIVDRCGKRNGGGSIDFAKFDKVTFFELIRLRKITRADRGASEIEKHSDVSIAIFGLLAHTASHFPRPLVLGVGHVETKYIGSDVHQRADGFFRFCCGAEGADKFGAWLHNRG